MSWLREMVALLRKYRQAVKDERAARHALDRKVQELRDEADRG